MRWCALVMASAPRLARAYIGVPVSPHDMARVCDAFPRGAAAASAVSARRLHVIPGAGVWWEDEAVSAVAGLVCTADAAEHARVSDDIAAATADVRALALALATDASDVDGLSVPELRARLKARRVAWDTSARKGEYRALLRSDLAAERVRNHESAEKLLCAKVEALADLDRRTDQQCVVMGAFGGAHGAHVAAVAGRFRSARIRVGPEVSALVASGCTVVLHSVAASCHVVLGERVAPPAVCPLSVDYDADVWNCICRQAPDARSATAAHY
jgi:hypothetical protein